MTATEHDKTRSFYDRISGAYDAIADAGEHRAREVGLGLLDVQAGERVLEIGYGTGHSIVQLAEAVGESGRVDGVDISQGMHDIATQKVSQAGVADRVALRVDVTPPLPYEENQFDVISMSFTLELFPLTVIPDVLSEASRVLRPGGRLGVVCMATTTQGEKDSALEKTYKWMHQHFPHIVDCQPIDVEKFFAEAGFEISQHQRLEIWTMPVAAIVGVPAK